MKNTLRLIALLVLLLCIFASCSPKKTQPQNTEPSASASASASESIPSPTPSKEQKPLGPFSMHLNGASGKAGEQIIVSLEMVNNPSIAGYSVTVVYDPAVLSFVECTNKVRGFAVSNSTVEGKVRVMCTVMGGNVLDLNGIADEITFKINDGAAAGSTDLQLIIADAKDSIYKIEGTDLPSVDCALTGCTVTITE